MTDRHVIEGAAYLCALGRLSDRERIALYWRYGQGVKLEDVGVRLGGVSRERARQITCRAVRKMHAEMGLGEAA